MEFPTTGQLLTYQQLTDLTDKIIYVKEDEKRRSLLSVDGNIVQVLRLSKDSYDYELDLHACLIGIQIINKLREKCINFSYTYYMYIRSSNLYVIREVIPGITLEKYLHTCTVEQFISCILQCLLAISYAQSKYKFHHGDLHPGNVIVHNPGEWVTLPYQETNLQVQLIAMIIDFDSSEVNSSENELEDIHMLIMQSALVTERLDILDICAYMYSYFHNGDFQFQLESYREGGGFTEEVARNMENLNMKSFTKFMLKSFVNI